SFLPHRLTDPLPTVHRLTDTLPPRPTASPPTASPPTVHCPPPHRLIQPTLASDRRHSQFFHASNGKDDGSGPAAGMAKSRRELRAHHTLENRTRPGPLRSLAQQIRQP